jgi:uncharacterized repeat protein (TIGR04052 family)
MGGKSFLFGGFLFGLSIVLALTTASQAASPAKRAVVVSFGLSAGGEGVGCGHDIKGLGKNHVDAKLHDARFYISALALIDRAGREVPIELEQNDWQYADTALLNFADKSGSCKGMTTLNDSVKGTVPPGHYQGLVFTVGVPSLAKGEGGKDVVLNHSNFATAPAPLDIQAMAWNWLAGRKFMKIEVDPEGGVTRPPLPQRSKQTASTAPTSTSDAADSADPAKLDPAKLDPTKLDPTKLDPTKSDPPEAVRVNADGTVTVATWMLHLGSTGCKGDPLTGEIISCSSANRIPVRFAAFNPEKQRVTLDLETLFAGIDLNRDAGGATGCMSGPFDPECAPIFEKLGLNLKETAPDANDAGKPSKTGIQIFRVESKSRTALKK